MADARIEELQALLPRCLLPDWVRVGARAARLFRDRLHPDRHEAILERLLTQARRSVEWCERRRTGRPPVTYPSELPITARKDEIVAAIRAHQVVIVAGETGSGKTTQLPKMCLEAGLGIEAKIGCTQPRRVAALSISRRIAEELNVAWGREVGCKIRFDDHSSPETYIKLMTDGILLAETQGDPLLCDYNALIIDEAHERSLNIDFLLGHLKNLLGHRPELKLIITSATIDTAAFSRHFGDAPIIEVSGRMYPVEVVYAPLDAASEDRGDLTYVDAAVRAAEQIIYESSTGDLLIFMPGERDIRETADLLTGRLGSDAEIIPLYGRLSAGDQQRVFAPAGRRKIIIATNIAETSLTIPGIRYVVDTGLARLSRYNPRTRTRRLPVEPVSQSSANQRQGRAGRVQDGVCIRLYSEEDFQARPLHTQPEIQRANLAEVILRMKAFRLGEIESFPFVNPPAPAAIQSGYKLLQELGALDDARALTPLGENLARLPIDPTLGRMLLQSQHEHATRELLIIAAGLSIQDPRERPLDQRAAADTAHQRFTDPRSDFLALLNLWNAVHDTWESLRTQSQRRRFCRTHFLSYLRMREWQDLHAQLHGALEDLGTVNLNDSSADYAAIHRSILSGLLGHVALRKERNVYQAAGNRLVNLFPGSALMERVTPPQKGRAGSHDRAPADKAATTRTKQPAWVVAGEVVETSQLFARTVAGIDPLWIVQLAPHLCRVAHQNPHWSAESGRVLVDEIVTLHGLEVHRRKAAYGNINPQEATAIFIRTALVEEELFPESRQKREDSEDVFPERRRAIPPAASLAAKDEDPPQYHFLAHNRATRQKVENWQTRVRRHDFGAVDEALFEFYAKRLTGVSSLHELNRALREVGDPNYLKATEADLTGGCDVSYDAESFPEEVQLGGQPVPLSYAYAPGETWDGVTLQLPVDLARSVAPAILEWAVPGLRAEQVGELLGTLPKALRRELQPFLPKIAEIVRDLRPTGASLTQDLGKFIHQRYGVAIPPTAWRPDAVPAHLRPRFEVVGGNLKPIVAGRDLRELRAHLAAGPLPPANDSSDWKRAAQQWERFDLKGWTFGDLPERITISEGAAGARYAWPGLQVEDGHVNVRLFRDEVSARAASGPGISRLVELALQKELGWLEKDLRALHRFESLVESVEELRETALENLKGHALPTEPWRPLTAGKFDSALTAAREQLRGIAPQLSDRVGAILQLRQQLRQRLGTVAVTTPARPRTLNSLSQLGAMGTSSTVAPARSGNAPARTGAGAVGEELEALLPRRFLETIPFARLPDIPRYLKALLLRLERAATNPAKDQERVRQLAPYQEALRRWTSAPHSSAEGRRLMEEFRWLLEEFKVSLFAQELGTAVPISPKRLDEHLARAREAL